jgi:hypothetical protein
VDTRPISWKQGSWSAGPPRDRRWRPACREPSGAVLVGPESAGGPLAGRFHRRRRRVTRPAAEHADGPHPQPVSETGRSRRLGLPRAYESIMELGCALVERRMDAEEPGAAVGEPGAAVAVPGMAVGEPGMAGAEPGTAVGEPGMAGAEPGTAVAEHGLAVSEPGIAVTAPARAVVEPGAAAAEPGTTVVDPGLAGIHAQAPISWKLGQERRHP